MLVNGLRLRGGSAGGDCPCAREVIAASLDAQTVGNLFYIGVGREADNWAIKGVAEAMENILVVIFITSRIEHHAVFKTPANYL